MKLAIGSGRYTQDYKRNGYLTLDADDQYGADIIAAVPPLPEFSDRLDWVEAIHVWEHLYIWQADILGKQLYTALANGGKLVLEMPDLAKCCKFLVSDKPPELMDAPMLPDPRLGIWGIYGAQTDHQHYGNPWQAHKWGYTPQSIKEQLVRCGFQRVEIRPPLHGIAIRDMRVEATKDA